MPSGWLPSVQRIIRAHGGEVELVSTVGQGSRFCLWLPIGEAVQHE